MGLGSALQANGALEPTKIKAKPRIERNRVLVTGGAGFVGSHLCTYLVERGDHVRPNRLWVCGVLVHVACPSTRLEQMLLLFSHLFALRHAMGLKLKTTGCRSLTKLICRSPAWMGTLSSLQANIGMTVPIIVSTFCVTIQQSFLGTMPNGSM
jgi:hypothetical protein